MSKITACLLFVTLIVSGCGRSSNKAGRPPDPKSLDDIANGLKWDYYMKTPKTPAYIPGQPAIVPVAQLAGLSSFVRGGTPITNANFSYCNLSPSQWTALRAEPKPVYLIAWSPIPDAKGNREVATVDLKTDAFEISTCNSTDFTNRLTQMESVIRKATGRADFSMGVSRKP